MDINKEIMSAQKTKIATGDGARLDALRNILASLESAALNTSPRRELTNEETIQVIKKVRARNLESAQGFTDAANKANDETIKSNYKAKSSVENYQAEVASEFLPEQLDEVQTESLVDEAIAAMGASTMKDMGKVMGALKKNQSVDMKIAGAMVRSKLG